MDMMKFRQISLGVAASGFAIDAAMRGSGRAERTR